MKYDDDLDESKVTSMKVVRTVPASKVQQEPEISLDDLDSDDMLEDV